MTSPVVGLSIALAAILVQAPRLVLALLAADRRPVAPAWEGTLLVVAGIGTALVLTGGNLYLAHTVARVPRWRPGLLAAWLGVLLASGALVVPLIAGGLSGRTLPQVLAAAGLGWAWSLLAALAHELTAAGCILASVAAASASAGAAESRTLTSLPGNREEAPRDLAPLPHAAADLPQPPAPAALELPQPVPASVGSLPQPAAPRPPAAAGPAPLPHPCRYGCGKAFGSLPSELAHLKHCHLRAARALERRPSSPLP
jgi:MFS family permease